MADYRYKGINIRNKVVQGYFSARNSREARKAVKEITAKFAIRVTNLEKKRTFLYKAQKGLEKPVKGEQKAFSKEDVEKALRKIGYSVIKVEKKLFDFEFKPPCKDVVMFIRICADLLREKLPFDEILSLLSNDIENNTLKNTIKDIHQELKEGKDGKEVFEKHSSVLGKFPSYMLGIASTSGDMASIYESTAKFLERDEEFKKSLRQALIMPVVVLIALFGAVIFYVGYIFPKTAELFTKYDIPLPPMTKMTLMISDFLQSNILFIAGFTIVLVLVFLQLIKSERGRIIFDKYLIKLPVIGGLFHKTSIEIFSRVFHCLYSGSGENITAIRIAAEACRNKYIENQIKTIAIPLMLKEGTGLVEAFEKTGVFPKNALSRLNSGAETGTLKMASLQVANYYEKETTYKLKNIIDFINISISLFIMVIMIVLTLVSSETAVIRPKMPGMQNIG
ncbi:type II secretion system F family protein [candidate division KSB1 bacterium]|nr:MAG: type II secretion system F family protein [candidate division KSB1 bacterium]